MARQSPRPRLRLGAHMSIAGGLHRALDRGAASGCTVIQLFTKSNQQWATRPITDEALQKWEAARARTGVVPAMAHASYLINLAAPDRSKWTKSIGALADEYARCARLAIPYLVVHPGAHLGRGEAWGVRRIATAIDRLCDRETDTATRLLLENTAGQGSSMGCRLEHLRDILACVQAPERIGVCIDTCHLFAAGYDIRTARGWAAAFVQFESLIGCARIKAFHVNDSKKPLHSGVDRHEHLGRGKIGLAAFHCLVNDPRFAGLPMTLETPKPVEQADAINLAVLRALAGRTRVSARAKALAARPL